MLDEFVNPPEPKMCTCYDCAGEGYTISLDFEELGEEKLLCKTCLGTGEVELNKYSLNQLKFQNYEN